MFLHLVTKPCIYNCVPRVAESFSFLRCPHVKIPAVPFLIMFLIVSQYLQKLDVTCSKLMSCKTLVSIDTSWRKQTLAAQQYWYLPIRQPFFYYKWILITRSVDVISICRKDSCWLWSNICYERAIKKINKM